jgi:hypothetical protein
VVQTFLGSSLLVVLLCCIFFSDPEQALNIKIAVATSMAICVKRIIFPLSKAAVLSFNIN